MSRITGKGRFTARQAPVLPEWQLQARRLFITHLLFCSSTLSFPSSPPLQFIDSL